MSTRTRTFLLLLTVAAAGLVVGACAKTDEPGGAAPPATASSGGGTTTSAAGGDGTDEYCQAAEKVNEEIASLNDEDPETPEDYVAGFARIAALMPELDAAAPPAVADDVAAMREVFEGLADTPPGSVGSALNELGEELDTMAAAVDEFTYETCGFAIDPEYEPDRGAGTTTSTRRSPSGTVGDGAELGSDDLDAWLEATKGSVAVLDKVSGWGTVSSGADLTVNLSGPFDADEALAVCEELADFVYAERGLTEATLEIQDDSFDAIVVREGEDGTCVEQ